MHVFASFDSSIYLELAITELMQQGIEKKHILAVPLDKWQEDRKMFDTLHKSDGRSLFDLGAASATAFAVVGANMGFKWAWGPIFWGLIGAATGFLLGFLIDWAVNKRQDRKERALKRKATEVIVLVHCEEAQTKMVAQILWDHFAVGVGKVEPAGGSEQSGPV